MYVQWIQSEIHSPILLITHNIALFTIDERSRLTDIKNDIGLKLLYSKIVEGAEANSKLKKNIVIADIGISLLDISV